MPELPEVETICQGIRPALIGQKIKQIVVRQPKLRWPVTPLVKKLQNLTIKSIERRAKYILLTTQQGTFIIHLGMSGRLCLVNKQIKFKKHDHIDFLLNQDYLLRYTDPRRFGSVLWLSGDPLTHHLLVDLGPEPLTEDFNADYLWAQCQRRTAVIKQVIMDQKMVVGVGNIYANEALYLAKISPLRVTRTITMPECIALVKAIKKILKQAIKQGGTTLKDFVKSDGKPGYFKQKLLVYGREGEICLSCKQLLSHSRIGQRSTVYCTVCQI